MVLKSQRECSHKWILNLTGTVVAAYVYCPLCNAQFRAPAQQLTYTGQVPKEFLSQS
jgi:hypothetical protein